MSTNPKRTSKRSLVAFIAAAMLASMLALVSSPASAQVTVTQKRLSGLDRYATAAAVAENAYASASISMATTTRTGLMKTRVGKG